MKWHHTILIGIVLVFVITVAFVYGLSVQKKTYFKQRLLFMQILQEERTQEIISLLLWRTEELNQRVIELEKIVYKPREEVNR